MRSVILFLLIASGFLLMADDLTGQYNQTRLNPGGLNQEDWNDLKGDYSYRTDVPDIKIKPRTVQAPNVPVMSLQWLEYAGYTAVILLLALIIVWLLRSQYGFRGRSRKEAAVVLDDDLDNLTTEELRNQLEKALQSENFRLAVRVRFLLLLKTLDEKDIIQWKREKTNRDYSLELRSTDGIAGFRRLAGYYEFVWYGPEVPGGKEFNTFRTLSDQLEINQNP